MMKFSPREQYEGQWALSGRRFLLLQGPSSRFFAHLGRALKHEGTEVVRIGFCPGDRLYWSKASGRYHAYRGRMTDFRDWLVEVVKENEISDIVMLGDGRAPHAAAIEAAKARALISQIWVIEHGYLRPNLILVEPDGIGGNSGIPTMYDSQERINAPKQAPEWKPSFFRYAALDVAYHMTNLSLAWITYPHYRPHSGISPVREYLGWIGKMLRLPARRRRLRRATSKIADHFGPVFLFPLQLSHDFQLRRYGTGEDQLTVLHRVIDSFEAYAPKDAMLVVKVHPLDNALTDWCGEVKKRSGSASIVFLDGGCLDRLLHRVAGVVTINSTVGLSAILAGRATCVLGQAVYDLPSLTHRSGLDDFWVAGVSPAPEAACHFEQYLRANWHVPGTFDGPGSLAGAKALAAWLASPPYDRRLTW